MSSKRMATTACRRGIGTPVPTHFGRRPLWWKWPAPRHGARRAKLIADPTIVIIASRSAERGDRSAAFDRANARRTSASAPPRTRFPCLVAAASWNSRQGSGRCPRPAHLRETAPASRLQVWRGRRGAHPLPGDLIRRSEYLTRPSGRARRASGRPRTMVTSPVVWRVVRDPWPVPCWRDREARGHVARRSARRRAEELRLLAESHWLSTPFSRLECTWR
jgi:hypothetical protein